MPDVTICIPTWQAERFIDETLWCARRQSHDKIRILVSVDLSEDRTVEICKTHARADPRVEVVAQTGRLGWAGNVNFLIEQVVSEYFFVYFHDDFIDPTYTARLLDCIRSRPDAASAHCDVLNVSKDGSRYLIEGHDHLGAASDRMIACLLGPHAGSAVLRGLMRTRLSGAARLAASSTLSHWAHVPFLLHIFAAGPILHVPAILYWRPERRPGGLVERWKNTSLVNVVSDQQVTAKAGLSAINEARLPAHERELLTFALQLAQMRPIRADEHRHRSRELVAPREISIDFRFDKPPPGLQRLSPESRRLLVSEYRLSTLREARHYWRQGRVIEAARRARRLGISSVANGVLSWVGNRWPRASRANRLTVPGFLRDRLREISRTDST